MEPALRDTEERFTILPILHVDLYERYKKHEESMWHSHEVKLIDDIKDWNELNDSERTFLKYVLAFFASSDIIVAKSIRQIADDVDIVEAQFFYGFQVMIENVHSEVYSNFIDTYITDPDEKKKLFNAVQTYACVEQKARWARKWFLKTAEKHNFEERLIANVIVEGVFFSGSFCAIYWLIEAKPGKLAGLYKGNDFISRDEAMHTAFAILLYVKYCKNRLTYTRYKEILQEAIDIEIKFITEAIPCKLIGMNSDDMIQYIKFVADILTHELGYEKIYNVTNPFTFMNRFGLLNKSNFFEHDPSEYNKGNKDDRVLSQEIHTYFAELTLTDQKSE